MKKISLLFVLLICIQVFAQIKGVTPTGRIILKIDKTPPAITITDPVIKEGDNYSVKEGKITIKGNVTDESEVKSVMINNIPAMLSKNNEFIGEVTLISGVNILLIKAYDKNDNLSVMNFSVTYQTDKTGPLVSVIEPVLDKNGEVTIPEKSLTLKIKAEDESGIKDVIVNGSKALFFQNNEFRITIALLHGSNQIGVKAIDKFNNESEYNFIINNNSDISGPVVKIIEPEVTRGIKIVRKSEVVRIKGIAADESGISEVTVNNLKAIVSTNGEFYVDMYLQVGENPIVVKATDNKFNSTLDTFVITRNLDDIIASGKYFAFIIGIDKYKGIWPPLRNAVNDAKGVEEELKTDYKFDEIFTLLDEEATRSNIISKFEELSTKLTKDDNLLIFYSGHGEFNQQFNKGFWVPVNAASRSTADYISNTEIQSYLNGIQSKHTILISDACFSGDIFRGKTEQLPFEDSDRYFKEVYKRASRYALTSGGVEPVTDGGRDGHSVFTYYLINSLKGNSSRYFTAGQLFKEIEIPVANNSEQTPIYQPLKNIGDEGGQFIFVRKQ